MVFKLVLLLQHQTKTDKIMKATFLAKGIEEVKTNFNSKYPIDYQIEKFRQDMLAKHGLLFTKAPHMIKKESN